MDIVICIPKTISWSDYQKELKAVESGNQVMNFRVANKPQNCSVGDKCYIVHDGILKGWMKVVGIVKSEGFECSTTGKQWPYGWYIQRSGVFHPVYPTPMKSFRGFKYLKDV